MNFYHHSSHLGSWLLLVIFVLLLIFAFEVWMFVDAVLNKNISGTAKGWWIIGMVLLHPFVAIIYFFTDHRKQVQ